MSIDSLELTGGESVYCINEGQLKKALKLVNEDPESSQKLKDYLDQIEGQLNRNERAALAFVIINRLLEN
jgi:hypothetical protein